MSVLSEIWVLMNEMSPYLLLGFLLAGVMHEFIPGRLYTRYLGDSSLSSVLLAAAVGVPLPLCSCGVIPTAMGIRREGASRGATVSFLIATPQTGLDSIIATYSLMGLPFAIIRPIVALVTAVFGGVLCNAFDTERQETSHKTTEPDTAVSEHRPLLHRLVQALRYAFVEMIEDIGKWLAVGLVIASIITVAVPDEWFAVFRDNSLYSILFVLVFSIPMYLCATGSIPIALALMLKGLTPGAALVLLMAGPASNAASILVVGKVLGKRTMLLYLVSIILGAVTFGLGIDWLLPREWFTASLSAHGACCAKDVSTFAYCCTALLLLLLVRALLPFAHHHHHAEAIDAPDTIIYNVEGMHCNHCAENVQRAIASVEGVKSVEVSLSEKTACVCGEASEQDIQKAVSSIGFSAERRT